MKPSSNSRNILITGANRGIGLALTRQILNAGDHVIAVCRDSSAELDDSGAEVIDGIDVTRDADVADLVDSLKDRTLDWVVNNAGILERDSLDELDFAAIERQFRVNAIGPLRVAAALRGNLVRGSRIFVITSAMGSIEDNTSGGYYGYRMSKAAVNMAYKTLSVDLVEAGIGVAMLHPGYVSTDMTNHQGSVSPEDSASGLIKRMEELGPDQTGRFRHMRGHDIPW